MTLVTTPNITDADGFYAALLAAHKELTEAESHALNARLLLILANHIGNRDTLERALVLARAAGPKQQGSATGPKQQGAATGPKQQGPATGPKQQGPATGP